MGQLFSDFEKEAIRQRAEELRQEQAAANTRPKKNGEADVLEAIANMQDDERIIAANLHVLVTRIAPNLKPKTWYGFPAYANQAGKVVLFFQPASKFGYRYSTLGFQEDAHLDEGDFWPTSYALTEWHSAIEMKVQQLIEKAIQ
ncbi:hypothetical protein H9L19_03730 [Weissella diestrammenae]|uniref:DUF1801 domain-containing protein n=1 Tax=Weissella diestrammenae TaxID=1162633 RepID=A0A7G9T796_9LACO|nr:hypothetical protein [Weissella diestrammenae]MCM0581981.1 hypothetical protein [Weissella diestrammenae]QNN75971.1 hypothetical protein H9L19_03730 [Weissella diestrammenae]